MKLMKEEHFQDFGRFEPQNFLKKMQQKYELIDPRLRAQTSRLTLSRILGVLVFCLFFYVFFLRSSSDSKQTSAIIRDDDDNVNGNLLDEDLDIDDVEDEEKTDENEELAEKNEDEVVEEDEKEPNNVNDGIDEDDSKTAEEQENEEEDDGGIIDDMKNEEEPISEEEDEETTKESQDEEDSSKKEIETPTTKQETVEESDEDNEKPMLRTFAPSPRRESIWDLKLDPNANFSAYERSHPNLVFVKGLKVGGTSVAYALNRAAIRYKIKLATVHEAENRRMTDFKDCSKTGKGSLYFHHGFKNEWQRRCIPNVRWTTLLREPVSQTLSWESFGLNRLYFINYPAKACPKKTKQPIGPHMNDLNTALADTQYCIDTDYRKNVTTMMVAGIVQKWKVGKNGGNPGEAITMSSRWVADFGKYSKLNEENYIDILKNQYFLVGVTERINEYLVLLALANGWDPKALFYRTCKPTNLDIHKSTFEKYYPQLVEKLNGAARVAKIAHEWAAKEFDERVKKLGPWFQEMVKEFETGLAKFQAENKSKGYRWAPYRYLDGESEYC